MKIRNCMALICAVVALSACGRTVIMREGNSSEGTSSAVIEPVAVGKKTAKEKIDLSGLSHDKVGYGQGVLVDEKNRTTGAFDFNAQYGKLNAKAINNDDKIYLTFDQGYENGYTEKILDVLKEKKVKATFFLLQDYAEKNPELVKRMIDEGHIVGNHTLSHPDMSGISSLNDFRKQLEGVENLYKETTGESMTKFYRPPQGIYSTANLSMAKELGYKTFFWSLAYVDWYQDKQPTREEAFDKLLTRIHPGAIVLLHNTSSTNGQILDELLTKWKEMGYTFGTLNDF